MKKIAIALCLVLLLGVCAFAQNSKATFKMGTMANIEGTSGWQKVLKADIKTASGTDLLIGVSMETNLYTQTAVASKNYERSSSTAEAGIQVKVMVDGKDAEPGMVVFDRRSQTLSAKLDGFSCTDANHDNIVTYDECTLTPEEIELILDTTGSHHFNFGLANLVSGTHKVEVYAQIVTFTATDGVTVGSATANAFVGKGSLVIDEVKLVNTGTNATVALN